MLRQGGIRIDDSEDDDHHHSFHLPNRQTQPKVPNVMHPSSNEAESVKQILQ